MEQVTDLGRRTSVLLKNAHKKLPSLPNLPNLPKIPSLSEGDEITDGAAQPLKKTVPKNAMKGTWERIYIPDLPRSSHTINIIADTAYIFGGEINAREPVDNDMHVIRLPFSDGGVSADYFTIEAKPEAIYENPNAEVEAKTVAGSETGTTTPDAELTKETSLDEVPLAETDSKASTPKLDKGKRRTIDSPKLDLPDVPSPRVGHASAVIGSRIFIFGGRGGPEMKPLDEAGRVWVFDTRSRSWSFLDPTPAVPGGAIIHRPSPRSYHCATATDRPRDFAKPRDSKSSGATKNQSWQEWALGDTSKTGIPQAPIVGHVAEDAIDEESAGYGTFFVHAGCLADGERTSDLWAFDVRTKTWNQLPAAPGNPRGGTAICISKSRLFRFGGYDGIGEVGGQLDFIDLEVEMFHDTKGTARGEVALRARGSWQSIIENNADASSTEITPASADSQQEWPLPRSVASLEAVTVGGGREYLLLTMGERSPSSDGHNAAGTFHSDVWAFQVPPLGMSTASVTDAFRQLTGRKTGEGKWTRVAPVPYDEDRSEELPIGRGWFASARMTDLEDNAVVIFGGLDERNERLGDGWILRLG